MCFFSPARSDMLINQGVIETGQGGVALANHPLPPPLPPSVVQLHKAGSAKRARCDQNAREGPFFWILGSPCQPQYMEECNCIYCTIQVTIYRKDKYKIQTIKYLFYSIMVIFSPLHFILLLFPILWTLTQWRRGQQWGQVCTWAKHLCQHFSQHSHLLI